MVADDALDVLEAADVVGDVGLQIDPVETADDGLADQRQPCFLGAAPASAVLRPAHRGDHRTRLVVQQAFKVGGPGQKVEAQLDEAGALFGGFLNLDLDHLVPGPANHHADRINV